MILYTRRWPLKCQGRQYNGHFSRCWKVAMKLLFESQIHGNRPPNYQVDILISKLWNVDVKLQFESTKRYVIQTNNVCSYLATFSNSPIWQVCPSGGCRYYKSQPPIWRTLALFLLVPYVNRQHKKHQRLLIYEIFFHFSTPYWQTWTHMYVYILYCICVCPNEVSGSCLKKRCYNL